MPVLILIVGPSYWLMYFIRIETGGNITVRLVKTSIVIVTSRCKDMQMCRLTKSFGGAILSESRKEAHLGKIIFDRHPDTTRVGTNTSLFYWRETRFVVTTGLFLSATKIISRFRASPCHHRLLHHHSSFRRWVSAFAVFLVASW